MGSPSTTSQIKQAEGDCQGSKKQIGVKNDEFAATNKISG